MTMKINGVQKGFYGNKIRENNVPSPIMKAWMKIAQRTNKNIIFHTFYCPCTPRMFPKCMAPT